MNVSLWHKELLFAASAEDVISTVRDFLVLWRPDELAHLPVPCEPDRFQDANAVSEYAAALLTHESHPGRRSGAAEALTAFFAVAAHRVAQLSARQALAAAQTPDKVPV